MPIRVLIVDDNAPFRALARQLLTVDGFDVIGEAGDGAAALRATRELRPDVVLLDVGLPDVDGFGIAEALALTASTPRVVLVSSRARDDYGRRVADMAAHGFIADFIAKAELSGDTLRLALT